MKPKHLAYLLLFVGAFIIGLAGTVAAGHAALSMPEDGATPATEVDAHEDNNSAGGVFTIEC